MAESLLEYAEIGYVSEIKEKIFVMKSRFYTEARTQGHACLVKERQSYRHRWLKSADTRHRVECRPRRRGRRWIEAKVPSIPNGAISAVQKMIELLELPPGWNSYNAKPITKENVNYAVGLLSRIMNTRTPAPEVVPMVRGGVQLEWHTRGIDLEISIYSPSDVTFLAEDVRGRANPLEGKLDLTLLGQWIDRLSG